MNLYIWDGMGCAIAETEQQAKEAVAKEMEAHIEELDWKQVKIFPVNKPMVFITKFGY